MGACLIWASLQGVKAVGAASALRAANRYPSLEASISWEHHNCPRACRALGLDWSRPPSPEGLGTDHKFSSCLLNLLLVLSNSQHPITICHFLHKFFHSNPSILLRRLWWCSPGANEVRWTAYALAISGSAKIFKDPDVTSSKDFLEDNF